LDKTIGKTVDRRTFELVFPSDRAVGRWELGRPHRRWSDQDGFGIYRSRPYWTDLTSGVRRMKIKSLSTV